MEFTDLELRAARAAWSAFRLGTRASLPPERMDDGIGYLQLSMSPIETKAGRLMLKKAGEAFSKVGSEVFEVHLLSLGIAWERLG